MNIIGVQLILIAFGCFMSYVLFLHWKKKNISNSMFSFWIFIWFTFILFAFFPVLLAPVIKNLFIVRVMDLAMIVAFMILTYVTIDNNIKIRKYDETLEKLIRDLSLNEKKK